MHSTLNSVRELIVVDDGLVSVVVDRRSELIVMSLIVVGEER